MKKKPILLLLILTFIYCSVFFGACKNNANVNYDNLTIKDWSKYTNICAGFVQKSSGSSAKLQLSINNVFAENAVQSETKLFGITSDNIYEPITFIDEDGNEVEQTLYLAGFSAFTDFIFVRFSDKKVDQIEIFNNGPSVQQCLITRAGKIFRLDKIFDDINLYTIGCYGESENAMFFQSCLKGETKDSIIKISLEGEYLKVEKIFDTTVLTNFGSQFFVDKFGNIFSENKNYIIKTDKTISALTDNDIYKAMNSLVYCGNSCFNAEGNLVESDFVPTSRENCFATGKVLGGSDSTYLIKSDGNTKYYYNNILNYHYNGNSTGPAPDKIYKYTFTDEISYTLDIINFNESEPAPSTHALSGDRLYFANQHELYYIDITNGSKTTVQNSYIINTIKPDYLGNIYFTGIDSSLNNVNGIIDINNNVSTNIAVKNYEVIYIKPLN